MSNTAKQEITVLLKNLKQDDKSTQDKIMKILYYKSNANKDAINSRHSRRWGYSCKEKMAVFLLINGNDCPYFNNFIQNH